MPRQLQAPATTRVELNDEVADETLQTANEIQAFNQTAQAVAQAHGLERYDKDEWIGRLIVLDRRAFNALLEMGRLVSAFQQIFGAKVAEICDLAGIDRTRAYRCAKAWRVFGKSQARLDFATKTTSQNLSELMVLPDEDLDRLIAGEVEGMSAEDVTFMSTAEARKLVKQLKADAQAHADIIESKDAKINDLDRKLRTWSSSDAREKAQVILRDAAIAEMGVKSACHALEKAVHAALAEYGNSRTPLDDETREQINAFVDAVIAYTARLNILIQR